MKKFDNSTLSSTKVCWVYQLQHSVNAYFPGKVGIQTKNSGNYELAVKGEVRAKEVRVETGWSDFVFDMDYPLLSLKNLEAFIQIFRKTSICQIFRLKLR